MYRIRGLSVNIYKRYKARQARCAKKEQYVDASCCCVLFIVLV